MMKIRIYWLLSILVFCLLQACSNTSRYPESNEVNLELMESLRSGSVLIFPVYGPFYDKNSGGEKIANEIAKQLTESGWLATVVNQSSNLRYDESQYELILEPVIKRRRAMLGGSHARWDGVRRRMIVNGKESQSEDGNWSGLTEGLSVRVYGRVPGIGKAFMTYGGITLATFQDWNKSYSMEIKIRDDLFESDREIQQGVEIALSPLLDLFGNNQPRKTP